MSNKFSMFPLGEVLTERREAPPDRAFASGEIRIVAKIGFNDGRIQFRADGETKTSMILVCPGDLVVSGINAAKGAIAIYSEENTDPVAATIHYSAYIPNKTRVDVSYLWWLLRSPVFRDLLMTHVPGGIKTELKAKRLLSVPIPLPPLDEQRRIVARIEELAGKIEKARSLRFETVNQAEALLGVETDRVATYLAGTYEPQELIRVVDPDRGISYGVVLTGPPHENGVRTLRAGDLQQFHVLLDNVKSIDPAIEGKYRRTRLLGNEVLLRIRGGLGEVAVCPAEMVGGNVSREIAVIPFTNRVLPEYGMYMLSAPSNQNRMTNNLRGTSYQGINLSDVRLLPLPIPPISEQQRVVAYLDAIRAKRESLGRLQTDTQAELDALLPSVLDKAFTGEL